MRRIRVTVALGQHLQTSASNQASFPFGPNCVTHISDRHLTDAKQCELVEVLLASVCVRQSCVEHT